MVLDIIERVQDFNSANSGLSWLYYSLVIFIHSSFLSTYTVLSTLLDLRISY